MTADGKKLKSLLKEIKVLVEENENQVGTFRFDVAKAVVALDFVKAEIEKTVKRTDT